MKTFLFFIETAPTDREKQLMLSLASAMKKSQLGLAKVISPPPWTYYQKLDIIDPLDALRLLQIDDCFAIYHVSQKANWAPKYKTALSWSFQCEELNADLTQTHNVLCHLGTHEEFYSKKPRNSSPLSLIDASSFEIEKSILLEPQQQSQMATKDLRLLLQTASQIYCQQHLSPLLVEAPLLGCQIAHTPDPKSLMIFESFDSDPENQVPLYFQAQQELRTLCHKMVETLTPANGSAPSITNVEYQPEKALSEEMQALEKQITQYYNTTRQGRVLQIVNSSIFTVALIWISFYIFYVPTLIFYILTSKTWPKSGVKNF